MVLFLSYWSHQLLGQRRKQLLWSQDLDSNTSFWYLLVWLWSSHITSLGLNLPIKGGSLIRWRLRSLLTLCLWLIWPLQMTPKSVYPTLVSWLQSCIISCALDIKKRMFDWHLTINLNSLSSLFHLLKPCTIIIVP